MEKLIETLVSMIEATRKSRDKAFMTNDVDAMSAAVLAAGQMIAKAITDIGNDIHGRLSEIHSRVSAVEDAIRDLLYR